MVKFCRRIPRDWGLFAIALCAISGCVTPPGVAPQVAPFRQKPDIPVPAIRTNSELLQAFKLHEGGGGRSWEELLRECPSDYRLAYIDERPVPGTAMYEYLRTGEQMFSSPDRVLLTEYNNLRISTKSEDESAALRHLVAGTLALDLALFKKAEKHFLRAIFWMEDATDRQLETLAALTRGDVKIYQGDPYERSMAHFFVGIMAYQRRDYQQARRGFSRALQADKGKANEPERGRFPLLHFWLAKSYFRLGNDSSASGAIREAQKGTSDFHAHVLLDEELLRDSNLTVLVQLGSGPMRVLQGADWETATYEPSRFRERGCDIYVDGRKVGAAVQLADLTAHADRQGRSSKRGLQIGKGAVKTIIQVLPYVNLLGIAWDVRGDLRSWSLLPGKLLVWTGRVPEGEHTITLRFYDDADYELTRYRQTSYYVPVDSEKETLLIARAARDKGNVARKDRGE